MLKACGLVYLWGEADRARCPSPGHLPGDTFRASIPKFDAASVIWAHPLLDNARECFQNRQIRRSRPKAVVLVLEVTSVTVTITINCVSHCTPRVRTTGPNAFLSTQHYAARAATNSEADSLVVKWLFLPNRVWKCVAASEGRVVDLV